MSIEPWGTFGRDKAPEPAPSRTAAATAALQRNRAAGISYATASDVFPCGHAVTPENTRRIAATGRVRCRECTRRYMRESAQRVRKAAREKGLKGC